MPYDKPEAIDHRRSPARGRNAPSAGGKTQSAFDGDVERYLDHLAQLDLPIAMKIELIRALRGIMQSFVDRAFGDNPVQLTLSSNGFDDKYDENISHVMLSSSHNVNDSKIEDRLGISEAWKGKQ